MSPRGIQDLAIQNFLDRPRFGTLATIDADGAPFAAVVWYELEGDTILVNSAEGRRWPANLRRDPRCSFMVEDGYDYVQILGRVRLDDDQGRAQAQMERMAARYLSDPAALARNIEVFRSQQRILIKIHVESIFASGTPAADQTKGDQ
jgi:PPOX class probable F420-dependent enzyme